MRLAPLLFASALPLLAASATATTPYVVLQDDGTIEKTKFDTQAHANTIEKKLFALYAAAGQPMPEILSVWSTFPFSGGDYISTIFDPKGLDVKGIGIEAYYPPDGTFTSPKPPLRSILFHNSILELKERAAKQSAPEEGFANYLFLLELSHNWGPALRVPGPTPDELTGFPFHWSFFMDAGGSPAGGNQWKDNGDGTYTAITATPATLAYSKLDLYMMGLAKADEVPPFGVLESPMVPASPTDPLWGGAYAAHSFPWFDASKSFTVTATRKAFTIDDVITATGTRDPAFGASPTSWKLGIVLLTSKSDTAADLTAAEQIFDPIAAGLAPAFNAATSGRGTLEIVTHGEEMGSGGAGGAGGGGAGGAGGAGASTTASTAAATTGAGGGGGGGDTTDSGCGCRIGGDGGEPGTASLGLLAALALSARRRRARVSKPDQA
jgi:MYXO-CTERM domain-containing protein